MLQRFLDSSLYSEAVLGAQNIRFAVLDEFIRPANTLNRGIDAGIVEVLNDGSTEAVVEHVIFKGEKHWAEFGKLINASGIEGLDPARIDESHGITEFLKSLSGLLGHFEHVAESEERYVAALADDFCFANFEKLRFSFWRGAGSRAPRIANR